MPEVTSKLINQKLQINNVLHKLRNKLNSFTVVNLQGQVLGRVQDFCIDNNRHLHMVISPTFRQNSTPYLLLSRHYIHTVDPSNREVIVDLSQAELDHLPVYPKGGKVTEMTNGFPRELENNTNTLKSGDTLDKNEHQMAESENLTEFERQNFTESDNTPEIVEEEIIRLLEEKLVVNRHKQKVGEVVIRKEIETRMVEVPVRREKLIVEQIGSETKKLAEIDLGEGEIIGIEPRVAPSYNQGYTVTGNFISPKAASDLLEAIALQNRHGCIQVRVELVVDNPELQETYQKMFDRCSKR